MHNGWLDLYKHLIVFQIKNFEDYISESQKTIKSIQKKFENNVKNEILKNPKDKEGIEEYFSDDYQKYFESFPKIAYSSLFISLYSLFEHSLKDICVSFGKGKSIFKKPGINECKEYLNKELKIDLDLTESWNELINYKKVRDKMIHADSIWIENNRNEEMKLIIMNYSSLKLDNDTGYFYIKDPVFLFEFTKFIKEYLIQIFKKLKEKK